MVAVILGFLLNGNNTVNVILFTQKCGFFFSLWLVLFDAFLGLHILPH